MVMVRKAVQYLVKPPQYSLLAVPRQQSGLVGSSSVAAGNSSKYYSDLFDGNLRRFIIPH